MLSLIEKLAAKERALMQATVLSPCVPGGAVRVQVEGLLYTFQPKPADFEGWCLWRPHDEKRA